MAYMHASSLNSECGSGTRVTPINMPPNVEPKQRFCSIKLINLLIKLVDWTLRDTQARRSQPCMLSISSPSFKVLVGRRKHSRCRRLTSLHIFDLMREFYGSIIIPLPAKASALHGFSESLSAVKNWQFDVERFQSARKDCAAGWWIVRCQTERSKKPCFGWMGHNDRISTMKHYTQI